MSKKGFLIDFLIVFLYAICLFLFTYFGYNHLYKSSIVPGILFFISIPICWLTIIFSLMGKNTIGNRIIRKNK